jgi:prepilin-type N-terminal cleavage/methylation domain-containing protein
MARVPRPASPPRGFTLIELVAAFGILAMATAVAVPAFLRLIQDDDLTAATRRVETLFRLARDSAIAGGAPVTVVIDSVSGLVWLDVPPALGEREWEASAAGTAWGPQPARARSLSALLRPTGRLDDGTLGAGTSLELPGTVTLQVPAARTRFTFSASGQAFGEHVLLTSALGSRTLTLHRWTGDVVVR